MGEAKEATPKKKKDPQPVNLLKKVEKGKEPTKETKVVPDEASKASHLSTLMDQMDQEDRLTLDKDDKKEVTKTNMKEDKIAVVKKGGKKATEETKTKLVEEMRIKAAQIMASLETTQKTSAKANLSTSTTLKDVDLNTSKKVGSNCKESRERKETKKEAVRLAETLPAGLTRTPLLIFHNKLPFGTFEEELE